MPKRRVKRHAVTQPLDPSYRFIALTQGKNAIVDSTDYDWLNQWNWYAIKPMHVWYACRKIAKSDKDYATQPTKTIYMHAVICGVDDPDHKDRDGLNNRRSNLRACTRSDQLHNIGKARRNTSGFKGVTWDKKREKWKVGLACNGKYMNLGRFASKEEAARVYDVAAKKYHGEFAVFNFPPI